MSNERLWPWRAMAVVTVLVLGSGVLALVVYFARLGPEDGDPVASVLSMFLTLLGVVVVPLGVLVANWWRGRRDEPEPDLDQVREDLAAHLAALWREESTTHRRVEDPRTLPVRWECTPTARRAMRKVGWESVGDAGTPVTEETVAGRMPAVAACLDRLPHRRWVILGEAGAGKSVLLMRLVRDLLAARRAGEPIPVLLPVGGWNPNVGLAAWVEQRLRAEYPGLAAVVTDATGRSATVARRLWDAGALLPVLDGLDELPADVRARALAALNRLGSNQPLVVASRPGPYLDAVARHRRGLARAAVVELRPVDLDEAGAWLEEAAPSAPTGTEATGEPDTPDPHWSAAVAHARADPDGPLAWALSTPLTLWLIRTVYEDPTEGLEALTSPRFHDRDALERHLFEAFLPAVLARLRARRGWTPRRVRTWLGFLAAGVSPGRPDIAWWELYRRVDPDRFRHLSGVVYGLLYGLGVAVGFGLLVDAAFGVVWPGVCMAVGITALFVLATLDGEPDHDTPRRPRVRRRWFSGAALRPALPKALVVAAVAGLANVLASGPLAGAAYGVGIATVVCLAEVLAGESTPIRLDVPVRPRDTLRADRRASVASGAALALTIGLGAVLLGRMMAEISPLVQTGFLIGLGALLTGGPALGFRVIARSAWWRFVLARTALAVSGRAPWAWFGFLEHVHRLDILRQVGATYQFQHEHLRRHLAGTSRPLPATAHSE